MAITMYNPPHDLLKHNINTMISSEAPHVFPELQEQDLPAASLRQRELSSAFAHESPHQGV